MKKKLVSVFSALLLAGATQVTAADSDATGLTMPEEVMPQLRALLEQAMRQSPRVLDRNLDLAQAEADGYMARAASLPSASGYGTYQWQREKRLGVAETSNTDKLYYDVSVRQAVWHWGALEASRKIARIDLELANRNYAEAYRALAAEIRSTYLNLVVAKIAVRNADHSMRLAQDTLTRQQARYSANQITYGVIMQDQLRMDEASLSARRTRADLEAALSSFRSLIGDGQFSEADIPELIAEVSQAPVAPELVASSAVEAAESISIAEKEVARAKLGLVGPKYNLYPKLGVLAGVNRDEVKRDIVLYNKYQIDAWYVGLQVTWTIFDGFSTKGQKLAAYTRLRRAERKLESMREIVARGLERERANLGFTWDAYQIAKMRLRMSREGFDFVRDKATRGEASQEQVDQAQGNLNSTLYSAQAALAAYLNASVQYLSSRGMDPLGKPAVQH